MVQLAADPDAAGSALCRAMPCGVGVGSAWRQLRRPPHPHAARCRRRTVLPTPRPHRKRSVAVAYAGLAAAGGQCVPMAYRHRDAFRAVALEPHRLAARAKRAGRTCSLCALSKCSSIHNSGRRARHCYLRTRSRTDCSMHRQSSRRPRPLAAFCCCRLLRCCLLLLLPCQLAVASVSGAVRGCGYIHTWTQVRVRADAEPGCRHACAAYLPGETGTCTRSCGYADLYYDPSGEQTSQRARLLVPPPCWQERPAAASWSDCCSPQRVLPA